MGTALYRWRGGRRGLIGRQSLLFFSGVLDCLSAACVSCVLLLWWRKQGERTEKNLWHKR